MENKKHTPGPWTIYTDQEMPGRYVSRREIVDYRLDVVASVNVDLVAEEANARLIAAAPSLLELISVITTEGDDRHSECPWCGSANYWEAPTYDQGIERGIQHSAKCVAKTLLHKIEGGGE